MRFLLTAKARIARNLTAGEIVEQIVIVLNDVYGAGAETPHGTNWSEWARASRSLILKI
jgi:adenine C2-methylase RlmN of 23S rRNA A2503 and tRNA A37